MAKRRGGSRGKAEGKQPARRRRAGAATARGRGRRTSGTRRARTAAAAHEVRSQRGAAERLRSELETPEAQALASERAERPSLRLAETPPGELAAEMAAAATASASDWSREAGEVADAARREAAEAARGVEAAADSAMEELRRRTDAASRELGRRREELEAAQREEERDLPGAASMGLELARGAARLVGAMLTAPIRIGLAFLLPREA